MAYRINDVPFNPSQEIVVIWMATFSTEYYAANLLDLRTIYPPP